ncbi:MAG: 2OG-Fe(II) oxygenase [Oligoflexus sp.]|nr:2OG-Fe(II) oxygenase [Oligoflexus sp.]
MMGAKEISEQLLGMDWARILKELLERGFALTERVLSDQDCLALRDGYGNESLYRKTIVMQRYSMGRGEYKYFADPVPSLVQDLRENLYVQLRPAAEEWCQRLGLVQTYPEMHREFVQMCRGSANDSHAAYPSLPNRRLQLPPSGPLW